jgi:hypothetical protein
MNKQNYEHLSKRRAATIYEIAVEEIQRSRRHYIKGLCHEMDIIWEAYEIKSAFCV